MRTRQYFGKDLNYEQIIVRVWQRAHFLYDLHKKILKQKNKKTFKIRNYQVIFYYESHYILLLYCLKDCNFKSRT